MSIPFADALRRATEATRELRLAEATRVIQEALSGKAATAAGSALTPDARPAPAPSSESQKPSPPHSGFRLPLGEVVKRLREGGLRVAGQSSSPAHRPPPPTAAGRFEARSFACAAGARDYKLFLPASEPKGPRGLVVMLHGCQQDPDDFAAGTRMNVLAEQQGLAVAYPGQSRSGNASGCWNWFRPGDQRRDAGEPAVIAGITESLMTEFGLERSRVFVAGLSAGGAMAAVLAEAYPDLYAAAGIHSGLPVGIASDALSAFAAMRGDAGPAVPLKKNSRPAQAVRAIVFHGAEDRTVHPSNAGRIVAEAAALLEQPAVTESSGSRGGRPFQRLVVAGPDGVPLLESWLVEGAGHAWSGGHPSGSYSDPQGPDASAEMLRFFLNAS